MVERDRALVLRLDQNLHQGIHILVAIVEKCLREVRQRRADVAKVHQAYATLLAAPAETCFDVAKGISPFQPAPGAELHAQGIAARNLEGALIALEAVDEARDTADNRNRGIIRVEGKPDSCLLGDRDDLPHEVGEIVPDLLFRVFSTVRERPLFEFVHLDSARRCASTAPVKLGTPHSRLFPRERGDIDPRSRKVPQELLERFDFLVSLRKGELDLVALA